MRSAYHLRMEFKFSKRKIQLHGIKYVMWAELSICLKYDKCIVYQQRHEWIASIARQECFSLIAWSLSFTLCLSSCNYGKLKRQRPSRRKQREKNYRWRKGHSRHGSHLKHKLTHRKRQQTCQRNYPGSKKFLKKRPTFQTTFFLLSSKNRKRNSKRSFCPSNRTKHKHKNKTANSGIRSCFIFFVYIRCDDQSREN